LISRDYKPEYFDEGRIWIENDVEDADRPSELSCSTGTRTPEAGAMIDANDA